LTLADATSLFTRQALHALALRLGHPRTHALLEFVAPPPDDFAGFLIARGVAAGRAEVERWIELSGVALPSAPRADGKVAR
jgi:hypothetical protein